MKELRVVFMGTPEFSVPVLEGLIENCNVVGVVTQPDKEVGRGKQIIFSPIKELALDNNIPVIQPNKIRNEFDDIINLNPDIIITCAYGQIIPKELLEYPKYKCINVHASLLPKLRGGAPLHRAVIEGYDKTGVTIMYMNEGMDTGDIISMEEVIISDTDTVGIIHDKLSVLGKKLLLETLPNIISGNISPIQQDESEVTFAKTIKKEDELIDFSDISKNIYNKIRGLNPFPVAYALLEGKVMKFYWADKTTNDTSMHTPGEIIKVYTDGIGVATGDYEIILKEIKPEGKKKMFVKDYLNGVDKENLKGKVFNG